MPALTILHSGDGLWAKRTSWLTSEWISAARPRGLQGGYSTSRTVRQRTRSSRISPSDACLCPLSSQQGLRLIERRAAPRVDELADFSATDAYCSEDVMPGGVFTGPFIIERPDTTIVVRSGRHARMEPYGNIIV